MLTTGAPVSDSNSWSGRTGIPVCRGAACRPSRNRRWCRLVDCRHYSAPYDAVPVARPETLTRNPEARAALLDLAGKINDEEMRKMNYAVDGEHRDASEVARDFLHAKGLD